MTVRRALASTAAAAVLMALVPALAVATPAAASTTVTSTAVADTYVDSHKSRSAYGTATTLQVASSPQRRTYVRFDVAGVTSGVAKAVLRVRPTRASAPVTVAAVPDTAWVERSVTWATAPAVGAVLGTTAAAPDGWVEADVTAAVRGGGPVGFALLPGGAATFASREVAASAPRLVVTLAPPADTTAPAVTLTTPADGSSTSDPTPLVGGAAGTAPGDGAEVTVSVFAGSTTTGTAAATAVAAVAGGTWQAELAPALPEGAWTAVAQQRDAAGNAGRATVAFTVVAPPPPPPPPPPGDTTAPAVTLTAPVLGSTTADSAPVVSGGAGTAAGDLEQVDVQVFAGTGTTGTPARTLATTASEGRWEVAVSPALTDGTWTAVAVQRDTAGNSGRASSTFTVAVTAPPPPPPPPAGYRDAVLADAPRAWWRLDETAGTTAASATGAGAGSYEGGPALGRAGALNREGTAVGFDGADDVVRVPHAAAVAPAGPLTLETWVRPTALPSTATLLRKDGHYLVRVNGRGAVTARLWTSGSSYQEVVTPDGALRVGAWAHVAVTWDGATAAVHVDGVRVAAKPLAGPLNSGSTSTLYLASSSGYDRFPGDVDDTAVYDRALPPERLQAHVGAASPPAPPAMPYGDAVRADGPAAHWKLDETAGTTALSSAGSADGYYLNGAVLGGPAAVGGQAGSSVAFDGVDDSVYVSSSAVVATGPGLTVEAWVNPRAQTSTATLVRRSGQYLLRTAADGSALFRVFIGGRAHDVGTPPGLVPTGRWTHLVATHDGATARIYVDGLPRARLAVPGTVDATAGAHYLATAGGYDFLAGSLDEVAVYPRALPADRVAEHYRLSGQVRPAAPVRLRSPASGSTTDGRPTFGGSAGTAPGDAGTVRVDLWSGAVTDGAPTTGVTAAVQVSGTFSVLAPALVSGTWTARVTQASSTGAVTTSPPSTFTVDAGMPPHLLAAGDIAACDSTGDEATAELLDRLPGTVASVGDHAYQNGTDADFTYCYDPTWGRHKARTRPAIGGHELRTENGAPYYRYFGAAAGHPDQGYYSYDLGSWHVVTLNENCTAPGGCYAWSAQEQWLRADLAASAARCTVAVLHAPRFSSGAVHGSNKEMTDLWRALHEHGVELVVSGDDHVYERFAKLTPDGVADPERGVRQFVVGTGGRSLYQFGTTAPGSEVRDNSAFGVLDLTLRDGAYDWRFVPEAGRSFTDTGTTACH